MKNKKFLMKVLGIILPIAVVAVAIISALSEQGSAYHTESTGYTEYSFECKNGSSAKFNEDGSFEISAPEGYTWKSGISDDRALQLSQNSDWQAYMKSLIAVSYYDSALSVYQLKTVYSSSNSANIITETRADGCHYKIVFPDIMISVEVDITWRNGFLSVKIPYEKIIENGSFKLQTIEILPFFGAEDSKTDGYIVYPDGCGALMNYAMLQNRAANLRKGTLKIYGSSGIDSDSGATLPVFGIKNGNSAVLAAVTTGAAECDINISPEGTVVALNRIAFSMNYRYCYDIPESDISSADAEGTATKADKIITNQDFEAVYLFLENEKANYSGMAGIYREFLQKNQMLKKSEQNSALSLALIMGESEKQAFASKSILATTFSQAENILNDLKNTGISDINFLLIGCEKGGASYNNRGFAPWSKLGGKKNLNKLLGSAVDSDFTVSVQKNFYSVKKGENGFYAKKDAVYGGNGFIVSNETNDRYILNAAAADKWYSVYEKASKKYNIGTYFSEMGEYLSGDYSEISPYSRSMRTVSAAKLLSKAAEKNTVEVEGANLYTLKYADIIRNLPNSQKTLSAFCDKSIPFCQMVLHGSIQYTGDPINLYHDEGVQLLNMIEYGYTPYYKLTASGSMQLKYTENNEIFSSKYSLWKKSIANAYKISQMLSSVQGETMSSHESDGIHSVVVYGNGAKLYVNYSSSEWTVDEKNVSAGGFLFVDSNGTKTEKWGSEK